MPLQIINEEREGIQILNLKGHLTLGPEDAAFRNEFDRILQAGKNRVILNFSDLGKLDTAGMGLLLLAQANLRRTGGDLAILSLKPSHLEMLINAKLDAAFPIFGDEQDAINSFFPDRKVNSFDILKFVESTEAK